MKSKLKFAAILLSGLILAGCNQPTSPNASTTETFKSTTVFNPNPTKVKLVATKSARAIGSNEIVCEVEPLETKEVKIGSEHTYYFTDESDNKIADLSKSDSGEYLPVYLELNEPKDGKEYLLLNQYKTASFLENYPRNPGSPEYYETYQLFLYEIIEKDAIDSYKYDESTYIRAYPSANWWVDSEGFASNKIGTKITYNNEFISNFTPLSDPWTAWGWSTYNKEFEMWFCHRVVSYVLHVKDGDSYIVKELQGPSGNSELEESANHISVTNVSNGIQVTITRKDTDPEWKYGVVYITENGETSGCSYSYFQNNKCILTAENNTHTFLYPFTTKGANYTFTINPYNLYTEKVVIVAENTSEVQLQNLSNLKNLEVKYEEKNDASGAKRIVKVTESPFNIFTNPSVVKYQQLCVNTFSVDANNNYTWIFNFGQNSQQVDMLLNDGLDFIGNNNSDVFNKTAEEFKAELNKGEKINFTPHFQFNTEPYSETSGGFIISLGSYTFNWTKVK